MYDQKWKSISIDRLYNEKRLSIQKISLLLGTTSLDSENRLIYCFF